MIVILKDIEESTTVENIREFLDPALKGRIFDKRGVISGVTIKKTVYGNPNQSECHAIVSILPDVAAKRMIKELNGKPCNGRKVRVCQYFIRDRSNRSNKLRGILHDRRREDIKVMDITDKTRLGEAENRFRRRVVIGEAIMLSETNLTITPFYV